MTSVRLPVYVRVGDLAEHQVGVIILDEETSVALSQQSLAGLFRALADEVEKRAAAGQN